MAGVKKNLGHLPSGPADGGRPPDADPWVGRALGKAWLDQYHEEDKPHAVAGTSFRFSMAGNCTRAMAFYMAGVAESDPPDEAAAYRMQLGTSIHESLQTVIEAAFPGAQSEVVGQLTEIDGSGSVDIVLTTGAEDSTPKRVSIEVKTINGFGFKTTATSFKGPPAGPRSDHVAQGALGAKAIDADELIIAYLAMENVSPDLAKYSADPVFGKFTAQWTYTREEYEAIADREIRKVQWVQKLMAEADVHPELAVPPMVDIDDGRLVEINPAGSGKWIQRGIDQDEKPIIDAGRAWQCGYCRWATVCGG